MKWSSVATSLLSLCALSISYASEQQIVNTNPTAHLDQSQNVFFEQFSPNTFSLQVLQNKDKFRNQDLIVGGSFQVDLQHWQGDKLTLTPPGTYHDGNGLYLTQVALDLMNKINHWSTVFLSIADSHVGDVASSVYVPYGFVVLGDLTKAPLYFTAGINAVPFGIFTGVGPWETPLTGAYFNPSQAKQFSLGFYKYGLNAVMTTYNDETNHEEHNAYSIYYNKTNGNFNYNIGLGYLTNLKTNSTGNTPITRDRVKRNPALNMGDVEDVNAGIGYGVWSLSGEYDRGLKKVGSNTKQPEAFAINLSYAPTIKDKVTTFGIGHSVSMHLRDIPTPLTGRDAIPVVASGLKNNWEVSVSRPIFLKNLNLGVELDRVTTYEERNSYTATVDFVAYI